MLDFIVLHDKVVGDADVYPYSYKARQHVEEQRAGLSVDGDGHEYTHFHTLDDARRFIGDELDYGVITEINN